MEERRYKHPQWKEELITREERCDRDPENGVKKRLKQSHGSWLEALMGQTLTYLCLRFARSRVYCVSFAGRKATGRSWRRRSVC